MTKNKTNTVEKKTGAKYRCDKSITGYCKHAGNKYYDYGFVSGTANYCRHPMEKRFVVDVKSCPLKENQNDNQRR
jgi:hypothetical protein